MRRCVSAAHSWLSDRPPVLSGLVDILRGAGLTVHENVGWETRGYQGRSLAAVNGIIVHHTAESTSTRPDMMARALSIGRKDLAGPLCHLYLDRFGEWWCVAAGWANHAGSGWWPGLAGNADTVGIEAANNGVDEMWPDRQVDSWVRGVAAIADACSVPTGNVIGHKEWAPGRKPDPSRIDMGVFRASVAAERSVMAFTQDEERELKEIVGVLRWYRQDAHTVGDKLLPFLKQVGSIQLGHLAGFAMTIMAEELNGAVFADELIEHLRSAGQSDTGVPVSGMADILRRAADELEGL